MRGNRLYQSVAEQIKALIDKGSFPPGSRLPGERALAEQFEVSRVTVREAEIALQAMGCIEIKAGSGAYVLDSMNSGHEQLPDASAFELTEARLVYESEAAAMAAQRISDETLQRLEKLLEKMMADGLRADGSSLRADREFHLTIAAASGNSVIEYIVETLWKMRSDLHEVREVHESLCATEDIEDLYEEHAQVLRALRERDPAATRHAMREHFKSLLESMFNMTEEQALREIREKAVETRRRYLDGDTS